MPSIMTHVSYHSYIFCVSMYIVLSLALPVRLCILCTLCGIQWSFCHSMLCDQCVLSGLYGRTASKATLSFIPCIYLACPSVDYYLALKPLRFLPLYCVFGGLPAFSSHSRPLCLTLRQEAHGQSCLLSCRLLQHTRWGRSYLSYLIALLTIHSRIINNVIWTNVRCS